MGNQRPTDPRNRTVAVLGGGIDRVAFLAQALARLRSKRGSSSTTRILIAASISDFDFEQTKRLG